ncbi:hypothetical protein AB0H77_15465 [Streptomyces sp. NPDC050844]|uniref:hypothetical protein n=1 Tax=Streptomyces sp. NPDC050844 TaxID=3155790 RepID=UPI0033E3A454
MSARDRLLDLFLYGEDGSQPEFEAALDDYRVELLRDFQMSDARGLTARFRAAVLHGAAERLRSVRAAHASRAIFSDGIGHSADLLNQWANETGQDEKDTATSGESTPQLTGRIAQLLDAIRTHGGEWTTRKGQGLYRVLGDPAPLRMAVRRDLHALHAMGHLVAHDERGCRFYTLNTRKGGA